GLILAGSVASGSALRSLALVAGGPPGPPVPAAVIALPAGGVVAGIASAPVLPFGGRVVHLVLRFADPLLLGRHLLVFAGSGLPAFVGGIGQCRAGGVVALVRRVDLFGIAERIGLLLLDEREVDADRAFVALGCGRQCGEQLCFTPVQVAVRRERGARCEMSLVL